MSRQDGLWQLIEPWLAAERVELDDVDIVGTGRGQTVRVTVDADGGVDIDRLSELSEGISKLLDDQPGFDGPYQLEVSSPGLERKLRRPRHFEKSIGREVSVKFRREGVTTVVNGDLVSADAGSFSVEADGETHVVSYDEVTSAKTVFRWEAAPKPGKK